MILCSTFLAMKTQVKLKKKKKEDWLITLTELQTKSGQNLFPSYAMRKGNTVSMKDS